MTQQTMNLGDVLEEFMTSVERPDRDNLESYVRSYPQYAEELAEFAGQWLLLDVVPNEGAPQPGNQERAQALTAMERLRSRLREIEALGEYGGKTVRLENPFEGKSPTYLKSIASKLTLDTTLMAKIKNRLVKASTVPQNLVALLAEELDVLVTVMQAWLKAPPRLQGARFKAEGKPDTSYKESFREAVRRSTLNEQNKRKWLD